MGGRQKERSQTANEGNLLFHVSARPRLLLQLTHLNVIPKYLSVANEISPLLRAVYYENFALAGKLTRMPMRPSRLAAEPAGIVLKPTL